MNKDLPNYVKFANIIELPENTPVFSPGDQCSKFFYLLSGSVRVDMLSKSGKEILLYRVNPGETCVITTACLISRERYSASATIEKKSRVCVVDAENFQEALVKSSAFRNLVFKTFADRMAALLSKIEEISFTPLEARLAKRLLELDDDQKNVLKVTHEQLAQDLGSAREVISRKLSLWEKQKLIHRQRGKIQLVYVEQLKRIAEINA